MKKYLSLTSVLIFISFYANSQLRPNDAAIISIDSPIAFCGGMEDVVVTVANMGDNQIDSLEIHWLLNGVTKPIINYTQLLDTVNGANPNNAQITIGNEMFAAGTTYTIKVWTSVPNGLADTINNNDTLEVVKKAGLSGNYTLDSNLTTGSGNYQSFSELSSDLNNFGVCGPVNVIVAPGVYNDFFHLSQIEGASSINTITIDGQDSISTVLVHNAISSYSTITLDGTDYITIKNMTVEANGNFGSSILFANGANNNLLQSNIFKVSTTSTSTNIINVLFSGNINSSAVGANANYNTIADNEIIGGYYGVRSYGSASILNTNNKFIRNNIKDVYLCGISVYYQDSLEIIANKINMTSRNNANSDGVFAYYSNNTLFTENYIHSSDFGAYFFNLNTYAPSTRKMRIVNNMIISDSDYGLYMSYVDSADIYHNSISVNGSVNPAIQIEGGTSPRNIENYNVLNNIFSSTNTEAFETNVPDTIFDKLDNNIYYTTSNVLIKIKDSIYPTLIDYTTSNPMQNSASIEGDPQFLSSNSNLKIVGTLANDVGTSFPGVTYDIEGDPRPLPFSSGVDIGADEYNPPTCIPPDNLGVVNVSLNNAEIYWTGGNNSFEYEYGMVGFNQGSGISNVSINDTVKISGLQSDTWYEFYVREDCGRGDISYWKGPFKFRTLKGVPFYENFETFSAGISSNPWPNDWFSNTSSDPNWESENATGSNKNSANTGPLYDHTLFGSPGGIYMYMETNSGTVGDSALLISPPIFVDSANSVIKLEYWYFNYGALIDKLDVLIESNGVTELIASYKGQQQTSQTDEWRLGSHILTGYEGKSIKIIFKGYNVACCTGDIAIDDVSLELVPAIDAGLYEIINPVDLICPGTTTPIVKLGNYGSDTLKSVKIKYSVNNLLDSVLFTGLLAPGEFSNITLNPVTFASNVVYNMNFYTVEPNNGLDTVNYNDTLSINGVQASMPAGIYTIDTSIARSSTNFHTINEAIIALETFGICGPTTFYLAEGVYNEQVTLDQHILGSNEINTITFDGRDSSTTTISHNATGLRPVLLFDGAKYFNFVNLEIENTASTGSVGIVFTNGSDYNSISNSRIKVNSSSTSSSNYAIVSSGSLTSATSSGLNANHLKIENNHIVGGFYGIRLNGSAILNYGNTIFNNKIDSSYSFGIYVSDQDSVVIEGNKINLQDRNYQGGDGIWLNECMNFSILSNEINVPHYGIYAFDANSDFVPRHRAKIVNNMIISTGGDVFQHYGVYLNDALEIDFFHNSIHVVSSAQNALYINGSSTDSLDIRNNIFSSVSTAVFDINVPLSTISKFDNNIFYTEGNTLAQLNGTSLDNLDSLRAVAPLFNQNSLEGNPGFISTVLDLHIAPGALLANDKGDNSVNVSTDIDGQSRPISGASFVDIGADEFAPPALNVGITSLIDPAGVICPGTYSPVVEVMNTGEDTIFSVKVVYNINGVLDSILNTDTILSSEVLNVSLNPINITSGTTYDIKIYTKDPNGVQDVLNYDDTLSFLNAETALVGTYTIDSSQAASNTNFVSFTDFIEALNNRGVCAAVVANVTTGSGPYNEQIFFNEIIGSSSVNTITINGNGEVVEYGSNTNTERGVFNFNNASYIVLNELVINSEGGSYGYGVHILDGTHDITINNCTIQNNSSQANTSGIVMSGSATNPTIQGNAYNITITNNTIIGGQYGISLSGTWLANSIGNIVSNNNISDFSYGIYTAYNDSLIVENNELHHPDISTLFRIYGIYSAGNENSSFNRNSIHDMYVSDNNLDIYPISISGGSSSGNDSYFMNTLIYNINSDSGNVYGIYDRGSNWTHFLNNTISLDDTSTSYGETRGIYQTSPSTGSSFLNNLITINRGATTASYGISLADNTAMIVNFNNVFIDVNSLTNYYGSLGTTDYISLSNWQGIGYGSNSLDINPTFSNISNIYTPTNPLLDSAALSMPEVSDDFYGRIRSSYPDIGAVEFSPPKVFDLELINFINPKQIITGCFSSIENVVLQIVNKGDTAVDFTNDTTNIRVTVSNAISQILDLELNDNSLNNGLALGAGDTILVTMGSLNMTKVGTYEFKAFVSLDLDSIKSNDTISMNIVNSASAGLLGSSSDTLCGTGTVTLSASNSMGDIQWQRLVSGVYTDEAGADSISYEVFIDSTVTFRAVACGTEFSDTITIVSLNIPSAPLISNDTVSVYCGVSEDAVLRVNSSSSGTSYNWYDAAVSGNVVGSADTLLHTFHSPTVNSADTFYVAENNLGCEGPRTMVIAVVSVLRPSAPSTMNDTVNVMCGLSGDAILSASSSSSSAQFNWYDAATSGNLVTSGDTLLHPYSTGTKDPATNYADTFYVAEVIMGCEGPRAMAIAVVNIEKPLPPTVIGDTAIVFCGDSGTAVLTASTSNNSDKFAWYDNVISGNLLSTTDTMYFGLKTVPQSTTSFYTDSFYVAAIDSASLCESERVLVTGTVACTVGENQIPTELSDVSIYPNPSKGLFNILGSNLKDELFVTMYNSNGKLVYQFQINASNGVNEPVDITSMSKGIYFIKLQSGELMETRKLIIH